MVSELCLGCMIFGQEADEEASGEIVGRFLDVGGNFLDTADLYSNGVSEEITGTPSGCRGRSCTGGSGGTGGSQTAPTGRMVAWIPTTSTFA
jgi:aldo/keto reductase family protein